MQRALAASFFGMKRRRAGWRAIVWIVLLSFTLQSYITQTHFHVAAYPSGTAPIVKASAPVQTPSDSDPASCPFCQAIVSAGAFFTPTAPLLVLPTLWFEVAVPPTSVGFARHALLTGWRSRAPPQH